MAYDMYENNKKKSVYEILSIWKLWGDDEQKDSVSILFNKLVI